MNRREALITMCLALIGCEDEYGFDEFLYRPDDVNARSAYIREIDAPNKTNHSSTVYTVLILSDIHFGAHPDHPDLPDTKFFTWLDRQKETNNMPAFCLVLGDNAEAGIEYQYKEYVAFVNKLETGYGIPVYSIAGNHDLYNNGWQYYTKYCKPYVSYYHFTTGNFLWYALDSGSGTLGGNQLRNLINNLKNDPKPKIVFSHYPIYGNGDFFSFLSDPHERAALISAFAKYNVKIVLEGHRHPGGFHDFGAFKEYVVTAFRDEQSWHLLSVDETNASLSLKHFTK
jgi:3',5'-cyclic AMP phosphodiesterase CpdA